MPRPTLESLDRELRELRAQLAITQTGIADLAASQAVREHDPHGFLGTWTSRVMGLGLAASEGTGRAAVMQSVERMVGWAEEYLGKKLGTVAVLARRRAAG